MLEYTACVSLARRHAGPCPMSVCPLVGLRGGWGARAVKKRYTTMASSPPLSLFNSPAAATGPIPSGNLRNPLKRRKSGSSLDTGEEVEGCASSVSGAPAMTNWPKFWIITSRQEGTPVASLSPFVIDKVLKSHVGTVKPKKLRSGCILVEIFREAQAVQLQTMTTFHNIEVTVTSHRTLNTSKGVVRSYDLAQMDTDELLAELRSQNVVEVKPIYVTRNGTKKRTNTTILTFSQASPPASLVAGYLSVKVEQYIPNPLRCFNCQKYGHHQTKCNRPAACAKCGEERHGEQPCTKPPHCVNCQGDHAVFDKACPKFLSEREVAKVRAMQGVSFPEARKIVENRCPQPIRGFSFAMAAKTSKQSVGTQTDIVHCQCHTTSTSTSTDQASSVAVQSAQMQTDLTKDSLHDVNTVVHGPDSSAGKLAGLDGSAGAAISQSAARTAEGRAAAPTAATEKPASQGPKSSGVRAGSKTGQTAQTPGSVKPGVPSTGVNKLNKTWKDTGSDPERPRKGSRDPIASFNKFETLSQHSMDNLDDIEMIGDKPDTKASKGQATVLKQKAT